MGNLIFFFDWLSPQHSKVSLFLFEGVNKKALVLNGVKAFEPKYSHQSNPLLTDNARNSMNAPLEQQTAEANVQPMIDPKGTEPEGTIGSECRTQLKVQADEPRNE